MSAVFFLIDWLALPLYIISGVGILWNLYQLLNTRKALRSSFFEMERELARRRQNTTLTNIIMILELCILVLGVQLRAVPYLEEERDLDQQIAQQEVGLVQDGSFLTDTPQALSEAGPEFFEGTPLGGESSVGFQATPTLTPTPVGTIVPNPPAVQGCVDAKAFLQIPANGMRVFQPIPVSGTAFTEQFSSATIELRGPGTNGQFVVLDRITAPITQLREFSQFIPAGYSEGRYDFRLMVFDLRGDVLVASCLVNIYIGLPPVTATPTPSR